EPDHPVEEVLLDEAAANDGLAPAPEEDAVGDDDADAPRDRVRGFDHVADEGVVAPALWRHAPMEAAVGIALGHLRAPLVEGEGRVRDDDVEAHEPVAFDEPGRADRVAALDPRLVEAVKE